MTSNDITVLVALSVVGAMLIGTVYALIISALDWHNNRRESHENGELYAFPRVTNGKLELGVYSNRKCSPRERG